MHRTTVHYTAAETTGASDDGSERDESEIKVWRKVRASLALLHQTVSPTTLRQLAECELEEAEAIYKLDRWLAVPAVKGPHEIIHET